MLQPPHTSRTTRPSAAAFLSALTLLCLLLSPHAIPGQPPQGNDRYNVLFIAVDDLKPLLGCYGDASVKTPNIDRIANRGMVFLNNHCQQAVCGPSRASIMTGMRPDTTGVYDLQTRMRDINPDILTLPQYFRENGYTTVGMGKIFDPRCVARGDRFDERSWTLDYIDVKGEMYAEFDGTKKNRPCTEAAEVEDEAYADGQISRQAVATLNELIDAQEPFFLAVGFKKPHLPFAVPKKYWDMYDPKHIELEPVQQHAANTESWYYQDSWELRSGYSDTPAEGPIPADLQLRLNHGYRAAVSYVDAQVGKVLDALENNGAADRTIIVLWGDHGWHLGDHGMFCKHTNYEQATRSPLIISVPGMEHRGAAAKAPTEFVDVFPTLCDAAGLAVPDHLEGQSLMPILHDPSVWVKGAAMSQYPRRGGKNATMGYAFRSGRYRYVVWVLKPDKQPGEEHGEVVGRELYDYVEDPGETVNVVDDPRYATVVQQFEETLARGGWRGFRGQVVAELN